MKKIILPILVVLLAAGGGAAWWFDLPARLGWERPENGALALYGNVDIRQVRLGFRVGGRIAEMAVDEGDSVKAGQLLARLDTRPYEDTIRSAKAKVASQAAVLAKLVAGPRKAEIAQARAALTARRADLKYTRLAYERARDLRPRGAVSQATYDQAVAARDTAEAQVAEAREALRLLEEGTRAEDLDAARANLQMEEADLASAETSLHDTALYAPDDGIVLSRVRERGAIVTSNDTVYVLSLPKPVWVRAYVPEPDLGRIHPGMTVEVVTDTAPDRPYRGRVGYISPVAEFTPKSVETPALRTDLVYRLRVIVDRPDSGLRQGMPVTVRMPRDANQGQGSK